MLVHTCNPRTWKMKAGGQRIQPSLYIIWRPAWGLMRPCFKKVG